MPEREKPGGGAAPSFARDAVLRGTVIASIITVPSLAAFFVAWTVLDDLIQAAIIGGVIHFIAMGFSLRISKKLLIRAKEGPGSGPDV